MKIGKNYFRISKKLVILGVLGIALLGSLIYLVSEYEETHLSTILHPAQEIKSTDRILVFAPHPDDESLGAGGLIARAVEKNATVMVVIVTDGSSSHTTSGYSKFKTNLNITGNISLPELRRNETLNALKNLGVSEKNVIFLGYPDVGLGPLFEIYWDYNNTYRSANDFNKLNYSAYSFSYEKNAPYAGANVVKNMQTIIKDFKPTIVVYPDDGDDHPDHWATSAFVRYSLMGLNYNGAEYTYLVHKGLEWPNPGIYLPNSRLNPPYGLLSTDANWTYFNINSKEENEKEKAILSHKSQVGINNSYFKSFIRTNDLFGVYPDIQIAKNTLETTLGVLPTSSYSDEKGDSSNNILNPVSDLNSAGISYDDQNVYLFMQTASNINNTLQKTFHLRLFYGTDTKRMDITVKNSSHAEYVQYASNSIKGSGNPTVELNNNVLMVKLPKSLFKGVKEIMFSVDIYDTKTKKHVDTMAFRNFILPSS
jgi:LmbE family N-acetylglucosaminyl deacetylase